MIQNYFLFSVYHRIAASYLGQGEYEIKSEVTERLDGKTFHRHLFNIYDSRTLLITG